MEQHLKRLEKKIQDYAAYQFTDKQSWVLAIFFDLAQEYEDIDSLYQVCELLLKNVLSLNSCLYLLDENGSLNRVSLGCEQVMDIQNLELVQNGPVLHNGRFLVPIHCNAALLPEMSLPAKNGVIGLLQVHASTELGDKEKLFLEKFANRIGYQLHSKMIAQKNKEHLAFIHNLICDIGHNVIVPNMYLKLLFRNMDRKLDIFGSKLYELRLCIQEIEKENRDSSELQEIFNQLKVQFEYILDQHDNNYSTFSQTSLFLETLLRKSHFEQGQYVLVKRRCNFKVQIIDPQINRYKHHFAEKGIEIDVSMGGVPDADVVLKVDIGLISQVFANLFSNAVKYTRAVQDLSGQVRKFMAYGWEWIRSGPDQKIVAIKLNVFTTGPHIDEESRSHIFESDFRAHNTENEIGSGRGLFFVKQIVELHGGQVGYHPAYMGNDFYIILPCEGGEDID